jgi:ribonuclease HI
VCLKTFAANVIPLVCCQCKVKAVHASCSKLPRHIVINHRKNKDWKCSPCNDGMPGNNTDQRTTQQKPNEDEGNEIEIEAVHIEWPDNRTSWVKTAQISATGQITTGMEVNVRWGKTKKPYTGKVLELRYSSNPQTEKETAKEKLNTPPEHPPPQPILTDHTTADSTPTQLRDSEPDLPKTKCSTCKKTICKGKNRLVCTDCKAHSHKSCSGCTRDATESHFLNNTWRCNKCILKDLPPEAPFNNNDLKTSQRSEATHTGKWKSELTILQWNADGLNPKIPELEKRADERQVDIIAIQETKLRATSRTPQIRGYIPVRTDRPGAEYPGGGLITYIKKDIAYRKIGASKVGSVEAQAVSIQQNKDTWLDITNVYVPPSRDDSTRDLSWIPLRNNSVVLGDFNAHSPLWDPVQPSDKQGEELVDWTLEKDLHICNNGDPTRVNRGTGGYSSPDITIVSKNLEQHISWTVDDDMGSDHSPIIIKITNVKTRLHREPAKRKLRWKRKGDKVNWEGFCKSVEDQIDQIPKDASLKERNQRFTELMVKAGLVHVGKSKPRNSRFQWYTPAVRTALKKRNMLRREVKEKREEWLKATVEARETVDEAKQQSWIDFLDELELNPDTTKVWSTIRSLSGTPDSAAPNEAMVHNGVTYTTNSKKADLFAKHYASVSRLTFNKDDRAKHRELKKEINNLPNNLEECEDLTLSELEAAIKATNSKGAAGGDQIPPTFLKNLGTKSMQFLLDMFNESFKTAVIPQAWRSGVIIPILKAGKPASKLESFRPISLTSVIVKALERMIHARLYRLAEKKGWINKAQAGFRKGRSCEDQILRITQNISDGFQKKPMGRTVLLMLDYSKAYDKVWVQDLLLCMIKKGVPAMFIKWIRAFLQCRTARVMYNGSLSKTVHLRQGLPQGAVLSPLLFLFFIDDLHQLIPDGVDIAMFADDASVWSEDPDLNRAAARIQEVAERIEEWSRKKKMMINVSKSEVAVFTNCTNEAKWRPNIKMLGNDVPFNPSPKFLGVYLDRSLSFQEHVTQTTKKASTRLRILACLASKEWGWSKLNLKRIFMATYRSVLDYAGAAWQPFLSNTQMKKLDVCQNKALRLITGQYASTPVEALRLEAGVESYQTTSKKLVAIAREKADRVDPEHPRYMALQPEKNVVHRTARQSWRKKSAEILDTLPHSKLPKEPIKKFGDTTVLTQLLYHPQPPTNVKNWTVHTELKTEEELTTSTGASFMFGAANRPAFFNLNDKENTAQSFGKAEIAIRTIDSHSGCVQAYTDGSCTAGIENGGAAAVITRGNARNPQIVKTIKKRGKKFTCSFDEEMTAMELALDWITPYFCMKAVICTDCKSLLQAIESEIPNTRSIRDKLGRTGCQIVLQWIPSHCGIPGNELADKAAKEATTLDQGTANKQPISYNIAKSLIKRGIVDPPPEHPLVKQSYSNHVYKKDLKVKSRKEGAKLAQLRSGHSQLLASYRHRIDETKSDICPLCQEEPQTVEHWLSRCPGTLQKRMEIFGRTDLNPAVMGDQPLETLALASATLR